MNPSFRQGKSGVTKIKRDTYGSDWWTISKEVKIRDGYRCIFCGIPENAKTGVFHEVHHLKSLSRGGTTTKANLGTTCKSCHDKRPGHSHLKAQREKLGTKTKVVPRPYVSRY